MGADTAMSGAETYCMELVNGRPCRNRVALPIPYTRDDIFDAVCSDCRRANVEAIAASEVDERLKKCTNVTGVDRNV